MDKLAGKSVDTHCWKERLKISKTAKFKRELLKTQKTNEEIAPQSREILQTSFETCKNFPIILRSEGRTIQMWLAACSAM